MNAIKIIEIYQAPDEIIAKALVGLLEKEGIKAIASPSNAGGAFRGRFGGATPSFDPWTISVRESDAKKAKDLLESLEEDNAQ